MRWKPGRRSRNLEDRRAESGRRRLPFPFPMGGRLGGGRAGGRAGPAPRMSLGGLLVLVVLLFVFKGDLLQVLDGAGAGTGSQVMAFSPLA